MKTAVTCVHECEFLLSGERKNVRLSLGEKHQKNDFVTTLEYLKTIQYVYVQMVDME